MKRLYAYTGLVFLMAGIPVMAQQPYIMVDQFGYRLADTKIAVIADPVEGFNAADEYLPGEVLQVRRLDNNEVVYSGQPIPWHDGKIQESSGDRGWWFDFSAVKNAGRYYLFDAKNHCSSFPFRISNDVYDELLKTAQKMFYYNRCNFAKELPWAGADWVDEASHMGEGQDTEARYVKEKDNPVTARDMRGGWYDAGDYNKYVTFAFNPVHLLFTAWEQSPGIFTDAIGIPESGNGIPDILDELKWEMDWIKRMQEIDGGVHIKIGYISYDVPAPPSADHRPRYYGPVCSSSTIAASGMFAHAALVYSGVPGLAGEVDDLRERAVIAWKWFQIHPKSDACDDQEIKSGDADLRVEQQEQLALTAAIYLFALTHETEYHDFIKKNIRKAREFVIPESAVYDPAQGDALLYYLQLAGASDSVGEIIRLKRMQDARNLPFLNYSMDADLYRAFMPSRQYHWGSNYARACIGNVNYDMAVLSTDSSRNDHMCRAINQLHYFHGVNPLTFVYLSNVRALGPENCAMHIWGDWYNWHTPWAGNPPPGFVTGGPNREYDGANPLLKDQAQPEQKMYIDFNVGPPENSWSITEPAIYYQAAYIKLLSRFVLPKPD